MDIGSESLFRVLDDVPEKLSLVSVPDFRILYANRLLAAATGVAPESVRGLPCHTAVFGRDRRCDEEGLECPVRKAAESGVTVKGTHECTTPAGGRQLVEITADPIRNDAGKVICVA